MRDTAANFTANNPILQVNEIGIESDTGWIKIGNGVLPWAALPYAMSPNVGSHAYTYDANNNVITDAWTINGHTKTKTFTHTNGNVTASSDWV